jgi:hypothetical protein
MVINLLSFDDGIGLFTPFGFDFFGDRPFWSMFENKMLFPYVWLDS